jgi:hypothetical protein
MQCARGRQGGILDAAIVKLTGEMDVQTLLLGKKIDGIG